ncbi:MAG: histidine--tRNA ligase [Bacteriovoracaceae bacterium]|nr:histidine--tRNA ligase [Bacteriovoracaceae bacterium]
MSNSNLSKLPYKGCRDLFPKDKRVQDFLFETFSDVAKLFGFESYDGPLLEPIELYLAKSGQELINEQIYSFVDRGERTVAIRPEMTPTLARMVAQVHREVPLPLRWFSIPNLMRYERPQKGRLREHWQFNCDIFSLESPYGEIEIFQLLVEVFKRFGANRNHFAIHFNSRELVDGLAKNYLHLSSEQSYAFYKLIDRSKKIGQKEFKKELLAYAGGDTNKQSFLENYFALNSLESLSPFISKYQLACPRLASFLELIQKEEFSLLKPFLVYDPTIVRGLDYYTGLVFEVFNLHPDHNRALCGGGAYDNLLGIFNEKPLGGIGFGLGDVTLKDFLECHQLLPDFSKSKTQVLVAALDEKNSSFIPIIANQLRANHISCDVLWGEQKTKKIFNYSDHKGHQMIILLGDSNTPQGELLVKKTKDRSHVTCPIDGDWIQQVKTGLLS